MAYVIKIGNVISFWGKLYFVSKHYVGTGQVALVPVGIAHDGRGFIPYGKPRFFKAETIEREALLYRSSVYSYSN